MPGVEEYAARHSAGPDAVESSLIRETAALGDASMMQVTTQQARLLGTLVAATGARDVVELGSFTGLSTLAMARGLPARGRVLTCDLSRVWTNIARAHWERAGVADRIELRLEPAICVLRSLWSTESVDLAFIDADKGGYVHYLEELVPRLRPGGLIVADNVLAGGAVADPDQPEPGSVADAMARFNSAAAADPRLEVTLLAWGDGLSVIRKLPGTEE